MFTRRRFLAIIGTLTFSGMAGCGDDRDKAIALHPHPIGPHDECHLCGMTIREYPGPKGQVFLQGREIPAKFCSTTDLFAWLLQPESGAVVREVFVHNMGATDWDDPSDDHYTDARTAWYVVGHPLRGAMGATLAAFASRETAEAFAARYEGARLLAYSEVDLDTVIRVSQGMDQRHRGEHAPPANLSPSSEPN